MATPTDKELLEILSKNPEGMSLADIHSQFNARVSRKTLLRALASLKDQGRIKITGQSRATRYHSANLSVKTSQEPETVAESALEEPSAIPLSKGAQDTLALVSKSLDQRQKVIYEPNFLRNYRPNIDYYLSEAERSKLLTLGHTSQQNAPAGTYARNILHRLLIDLSWNSSRLEGNTYSLLDTKLLLEQNEANPRKTNAETEMIRNHKEAIEFLVEGAQDIGLNRYTLLNLHAILSNNLLPDPMASGRLRTFAVGIGRSSYTPPTLPAQVEEYFDVLLEKAAAITDPFEQALFVMVHIPYLQPFEDVNKRVSRLAANIPFNRVNLAPLSFIDLPQDIYIKGLLGVYELNRVDLYKEVFIYAYEKSAARYAQVRQTLGEPDPFRQTYRDAIRTTVFDVIVNKMDQIEAKAGIETDANALPEKDRRNFIEVVEGELISLHTGNFARYRVTPLQFSDWQRVWSPQR